MYEERSTTDEFKIGEWLIPFNREIRRLKFASPAEEQENEPVEEA